MPYAKRSRAIANGYTPSGKRARSNRYSVRSQKMSVYRKVNKWPYQVIGTSQIFDPFPAKITARMRYSTTIYLTPGLGSTDSYLFRCNSIHDPDATGIGHQPYGHDTYQNIYNHYNVRSSTITMTATSPRSAVFGITLTDDGTVQGNYDTVGEVKNTVIGTCQDNAESVTIAQKFNVNKSFDVPFQKATSASFGATPAEQMFFHCWAKGPRSDVVGSPNSFLITVTYLVDMWELRDLGQS